MPESTADLWDARSEELMSCNVQFRSYGAIRSFAGPVRTVRCHEDNQLVKQLLNSPGDGSVLVVDGGGSLRSALVGDQIGAAAVANGWVGIVIHGAVRDSDALSALEIGIKALGTNPRRSSKAGEGSIDESVAFGGATFVPGAHLWADADGIVVEIS